MNVAKIEYNLGNMKDYENQSEQEKIRNSKNTYNYCSFWRKIDIDAPRQKLGTHRMLIITVVFEENSMLTFQNQKGRLQECLYLLSFLKDFDDNKGRGEMTDFENVNISKDVWQKWGTCDFETNDSVRNFEFPGCHGKILKSAESRKWTALQTYDKNEGRRREAKPGYHKQLRET